MIDFLFVLITSSFAGSVMIIIVKIIDFFLKEHGARLQYLLMRIMLFMYFLSTAAIAVTAWKSRILYIQDGEIEDFPYVEHLTGWGFKEVFGTDSYKYFTIILCIWIVGFIYVELDDLIHGKMFLKNILKFSTKCDDDHLEEQKQNIQKKMHIQKNVDVYRSSAIDTPFTTGVFRPKVVLPEQNFSEDELEFILKHEFTHLRRKETFYKFIMGMIKGVNWFNPLFLFFTKDFYNYSEMTCDELVLENEGREIRFQYSKLLLLIAGDGLDNETVAALKNSNEKTMERRIINIMMGDRKVERLIAFIVSLLFLSVCFAVIYISSESTTVLREWVIEEKRVHSGKEEKMSCYIFPGGEQQFASVPMLNGDGEEKTIVLQNRGVNLVEVDVEALNLFELTRARLGYYVRFNLFSQSPKDRFQVGILNLDTGCFKYARTESGGMTHTFEITQPGEYVAFVINENRDQSEVRLFGDIYTIAK